MAWLSSCTPGIMKPSWQFFGFPMPNVCFAKKQSTKHQVVPRGIGSTDWNDLSLSHADAIGGCSFALVCWWYTLLVWNSAGWQDAECPKNTLRRCCSGLPWSWWRNWLLEEKTCFDFFNWNGHTTASKAFEQDLRVAWHSCNFEKVTQFHVALTWRCWYTRVERVWCQGFQVMCSSAALFGQWPCWMSVALGPRQQ